MIFNEAFEALTGHKPLPWQERLYHQHIAIGEIRPSCCLPTGLGKTSVVAIWLIGLANGAPVPRRLVYVVNRRTVVDQTTVELERYKTAIDSNPKLADFKSRFEILRISTLRGQFADNGDWCEDPSRPAVICGTVDMIGSRLLFSGYGIGRAKRPLHAGFLGQDALLIHDEAHLEPAFQKLIETVEAQQRDHESECLWPKLKVMELTATTRSQDSFSLNEADHKSQIVIDRMTATKRLHLHELVDSKKPAKELLAKAIEFKNSNKAILVFAQSVETVLEIQAALDKAGLPCKSLTGTIRGYERDNLIVDDKTFARFFPDSPDNATKGTVYLVCTSAGEVGVNLSADHLVCDLTTFESMTQRLGRVNRFGQVSDCEVHVFYPAIWDEKSPLTVPRQRTLKLLLELEAKGDANPKNIGELSSEARSAAFAPMPTLLPTTDMLFDAWALTTITAKLPGRPPVAPYLHGLTEYEPPETLVAWRHDVQLLNRDGVTDRDRSELLLAYPIFPQELLREPSYRAFSRMEALGRRHRDHVAWLVNADGDVETVKLEWFTSKENKEAINGMTIVLDPQSGGLSAVGMLDGTVDAPASDVSKTPERCRDSDHGTLPPDMQEVFSLELRSEDEEVEPDILRWFARRNSGEVRSKKPVLLVDHVSDVQLRMDEILKGLSLGPSIEKCLKIAAEFHDHGKRRLIFQTMLGNRKVPSVWWAKSGRKSGPRLGEAYRHEFGSLHELPDAAELGISDDERELVLHLIAAHHGRARPHFPVDEAFDPDPERSQADSDQLACTVPQRFGRLQRKYGRWGLAYLESLLRAADWSASANPSQEVEENQ